MHTVIIDIETNAIDDWLNLSDLETIHCLVVRTKTEVQVYNSQRGDIEEGLREIENADIIVGHNLLKFDIPALKKKYEFNPKGSLRDTKLMAQLAWPDTRNDDFKLPGFPKVLIGSHSLQAWGERLGEFKGEYGETTDWSVWTQEMEDYCVQDTLVTLRLWEAIQREEPAELSVSLEHDFAEIIRLQEINGFRFDTEKAKDLHATLLDNKAKLERELQEIFPAAEVPMKTPQYWLASGKQYSTKGAAKKDKHKDSEIRKGPLRVKRIPFNPGSRDQIAQQLIKKYGWKPEKFTGEGKPQIDESILNALEYKEARVLMRYLTITKRLGQLADGKEAWLKNQTNGWIHGTVNTNGTVSGRCTHARPNVSQVPSTDSWFGKECRSLFLPNPNHVLVGCDASGLELRMLAHYLAFADGGKYVKLVTEGDPHTANQEAAGLPTRAAAKTFIYALIYGSGDQNLGGLVGGGIKEGKAIRKKFMDGMPAFKKLKVAVDLAVDTKGYLTGLDGRKLPVRSKHSALNLLLQSAGAVVMKTATVVLAGHMRRQEAFDHAVQVAHIHDEVQLSCSEEVANELGKTACRSIVTAGRILELRCPLDAEFRVGANWAETH
tara:strand:- start:1205 stop:3022 length:1818 start_codon:yes stop_codon:yes gene_type:complete